jgi:hypothetical protein
MKADGPPKVAVRPHAKPHAQLAPKEKPVDMVEDVWDRDCIRCDYAMTEHRERRQYAELKKALALRAPAYLELNPGMGGRSL